MTGNGHSRSERSSVPPPTWPPPPPRSTPINAPAVAPACRRRCSSASRSPQWANGWSARLVDGLVCLPFFFVVVGLEALLRAVSGVEARPEGDWVTQRDRHGSPSSD